MYLNMNREIYIAEFENELDECLDRFISRFGCRMRYGSADLSAAVRQRLERNLSREAGRYAEARLEGMSHANAFSRVRRLMELFSIPEESTEMPCVSEIDVEWQEALKPFKEGMLAFALTPEEIIADSEFFKGTHGPALLLTKKEWPDSEVDFPDDYSALTFPYTARRLYDNPYLRGCFPSVYNTANTISMLIRTIDPQKITLYNRNSMESMAFSALASDAGIPIEYRF